MLIGDTPREMITFRRNNIVFGLRVAGIAIHEGHILLHRAESDDFWALPGGRDELLEPAATSLKREMKEEMNADVTVMRLLWVVENFFEYGQRCHELGLYFLIDLGSNFPHYDKTRPFFGIEDGLGSDKSLRLIFQWFPVDRLETERLFPTFLRTGLRDIPAHTQHIVHYDTDDEGQQ
jgi:ADP-ribose pyrophosphatase YjhB (NUDIX family)